MSNAIAITLDSKARAAYESRVRAEEAREYGPRRQSPGEYRSAIARLAAAMPDAVKIH